MSSIFESLTGALASIRLLLFLLILYGFLFTAPNYIHDESKQVWKTYQERLYAILKSIIEEGIKKNEFIDLDPGMLMKAIGGLFHGLLIENEDDLDNKEFELMLQNFLRPKNAKN